MGLDYSTPEQSNKSSAPTPITGSVWNAFSHTSSQLTNKLETEFYHNFNSQQSWQEAINYIQFLKSIRHPNILRYMSESISTDRITLRTQPTIPLKLFSHQCSKSHLVQGIRDIATGLKFLQTTTKLCHLGICLGEVFIDTFTGCWLLGGFGLTRKMEATSINELLALDMFSLLKEEASQNDSELDSIVCLDIWLFKQFVNEVIEASKYKYFLENLLEWLDTSWSELSFDEILVHEDLNNLASESIDVLTRISLVDQQEKLLFIESLPTRLPKLDESVLAFRISPFIFSPPLCSERFVRDSVIPYLLIPKSKKFLKEISRYQVYIQNALLSEEMFKLYMVPLILRLYSRRELNLRLTLLKFFKYYIYLFTYQQQLQLHQEILVGLRDSREELAKLTFFALGELTSYLGVVGVTGRVVNTIFTDTQPRDYQLSSSPMESYDTDENECSPSAPDSPAKFDSQMNDDEDPSIDPFFANELRQERPKDQPIDLIKTEDCEAKLYSVMRRPKLNLRPNDQFHECEHRELDKVEIREEIQPNKPTLLELSRGMSLRGGTKVISKVEYDSTSSDGTCGDDVTQAEGAWEDWDPFT